MASGLRWSLAELREWEQRMSKVNDLAPVTHVSRMNKTEARYQAEVLEARKVVGEVLEYGFERIKLRLADNTFYTPDFFVVCSMHLEFHEVKGHWEDDARVKIKVAAQQFPWFRFIAVQRQKGEWRYEGFRPA